MVPKLTPDQRHALTRHHDRHKNTWKTALRSLWFDPWPPAPGPDFKLLFDLKESHGERWLRDACITSIRIGPLPRNAARVLQEMQRAPALTSVDDPNGITVWRRIDTRRIRDLLLEDHDKRWWGGVLSCLRSRELYRPDAPNRRLKSSGFGWVCVLRAQ